MFKHPNNIKNQLFCRDHRGNVIIFLNAIYIPDSEFYLFRVFFLSIYIPGMPGWQGGFLCHSKKKIEILENNPAPDVWCAGVAAGDLSTCIWSTGTCCGTCWDQVCSDLPAWSAASDSLILSSWDRAAARAAVAAAYKYKHYTDIITEAGYRCESVSRAQGPTTMSGRERGREEGEKEEEKTLPQINWKRAAEGMKESSSGSNKEEEEDVLVRTSFFSGPSWCEKDSVSGHSLLQPTSNSHKSAHKPNIFLQPSSTWLHCGPALWSVVMALNPRPFGWHYMKFYQPIHTSTFTQCIHSLQVLHFKQEAARKKKPTLHKEHWT